MHVTGSAQLLVAALRAARPQTDTQVLEKLAAAPQRAPLVIVLVVRPVEHPKVPRIEQMLSLACAVQNMQLAAYALGFGSIWRTGDVTYVDTLATQLGLEAGDRVAGFLYLGTPRPPREPVALDPTQFFAHWQAARALSTDLPESAGRSRRNSFSTTRQDAISASWPMHWLRHWCWRPRDAPRSRRYCRQ